MEVKIISKEYIKPISPTPSHLKTHQLSVLDQLNSHAYIPYLFFYQNKMDTNNEIPEKLLRLKQGLSETLTHFYPLAGEIKENHQEIDCNDNGVYYVETQVNMQVLDLLKNPETKLLHKLLTYSPNNKILLSKTCITMVQVNSFSCGGLVIGLYTSHKMIDGFSATLFWKSWASAAKGSSYQECPKFDTHEMFNLIPSLPKYASLVMWPSFMGKCKFAARRLVFDSEAIGALKADATLSSTIFKKPPSRVVVVIGYIWKRLMAASISRSGVHKPSILTISVNLRGKTSPPSFNSIGNMLWFAVAKYHPENTNKDIELSSVVGCLHDAIAKIDKNFVDDLKGGKGSVNLLKHMENLRKCYSESDEEADYVVASSLCNAALYDIDFGWGEPTWLCHGGVDADCPALTNLIVLADTKSGGGIEVQLSLDEGLMNILENDHEMLSFASINHCPL